MEEPTLDPKAKLTPSERILNGRKDREVLDSMLKIHERLNNSLTQLIALRAGLYTITIKEDLGSLPTPPKTSPDFYDLNLKDFERENIHLLKSRSAELLKDFVTTCQSIVDE